MLGSNRGTLFADVPTLSVNIPLSVSPSASSTVTVITCSPVASGVPDRTRPETVSHAGLPLRVYVSVPSPPVAAAIVALYATFRCARLSIRSGRTGVVSNTDSSNELACCLIIVVRNNDRYCVTGGVVGTGCA